MYAHTKQTAEERLAWLLFWGLGMVHGLVWITALVVPIYGTTPNTLWREYGEHGGSHMTAAGLARLTRGRQRCFELSWCTSASTSHACTMTSSTRCKLHRVLFVGDERLLAAPKPTHPVGPLGSNSANTRLFGFGALAASGGFIGDISARKRAPVHMDAMGVTQLPRAGVLATGRCRLRHAFTVEQNCRRGKQA